MLAFTSGRPRPGLRVNWRSNALANISVLSAEEYIGTFGPARVVLSICLLSL